MDRLVQSISSGLRFDRSGNDSLASTTTTAAIVVTTTTLFAAGLHAMLSSRRKPRRGCVTCRCGQIEIELHQPAANYIWNETPSFLCACTDCVGFAEKVLAAGAASDTTGETSCSKASSGEKSESKDFCTPGVPNWILYDSEIMVLKGHDLLQSMKLSKKTENRRIYSKCCGTPIGISVDGSPLNFIFPRNRKEPKPNQDSDGSTIDFPDLSPYCCVYAGEADPTKPVCPDSMVMYKGAFAPQLVWHCLSRLILLAFVGTRGPGSGFPMPKAIDYGLDTIQVQKPLQTSAE